MALVGPFIAQAGYALAIAATSAAISYLLSPRPEDQHGPRLDDLTATTSAYGKFRTIAYGRISNPGNVIDASDLRETRHKEKVGGKGGKSSSYYSYTYSQDIALGLGEEIGGVEKIYANEKLLYDANGDVQRLPWLEFKIYLGTEDQEADPTLQALHGVDNTPAYRGEAYIVFKDFQLEDFGNRMPTFRVVTITNASNNANEYIVNSSPGDPTSECILSDIVQDPISGNVISAWTYIGTNSGPLATVVEPYNNEYIKNLTSAGIDPEDISSVAPMMGGQPGSEYSIIAFKVVEDTGGGGHTTHIVMFDAYDYSYIGTAELDEFYNDTIFTINPYKDYIVITGLHHISSVSNTPIMWLVTGLGEIERVEGPSNMEDMVDDWYAFNMTTNTNGAGSSGAGDGAILLYSEIDSGSTPTVIKIGYPSQAVQWTTEVPSAFMSGDPNKNAAVTNAMYDSEIYDPAEEEYVPGWWTASQGDIWAFRDSDGSTIGTWDIASDPNYVAMNTKPTFDPNTKHIYWIDYNAGGDVPGAWDTVDRTTVSKWTVDSYESSSGLNGGDNLAYFYPTGSLYYASQNVTRTDPLRRFQLNNLTNNGIYLSEILSDICDRCGLEVADYDVTDCKTTPVDGYHIAKMSTGRANIAPLQHGYLFDGIDSGGTVKFIMKGKASVATIERDDLGAGANIKSDLPLIKSGRIMEHMLPKYGNILYINPADSKFEPGLQKSSRVASQNTNTLKLELPISFTDDSAKQLIDKILHITHIEREFYEINVLPKWIHLEAADVIDVAGATEYFRVRITKTSFQNGVMHIEAVREEQDSYTSYVTGDEAPPKDDVVVIPGIMLFQLLDIPLLRDSDDNAGHYCVASSYNDPWEGGVIYKSIDNVAWGETAIFTSKSTYGTLMAELPRHTGALWDDDNEILVDMISGDFETETKSRVLQGYNAILVGNNDSRNWEIINFVTATETSAGVYKLDGGLIRYRLGTDSLIDADHPKETLPVGSYVVLLDVDNLKYIEGALTEITKPLESGADIQYKGVSFGMNVIDPSVRIKSSPNYGTCLKPYAPTQLKGLISDYSTLDLKITWMPRSRYEMLNFWDGAASESTIGYTIYIFDRTNTNLVRTVANLTTPEYTYSRTDQESDLVLDGYQEINVVVLQESDRMDYGYHAEGSMFIGLAPRTYDDYIINQQPLGFWQFNEELFTTDAEDAMGNFPDMVYSNPSVGSLTQQTLLPSNPDTYTCFSNSGTSNFVQCTAASSLWVTGQQFSFSFVLKIIDGTDITNNGYIFTVADLISCRVNVSENLLIGVNQASGSYAYLLTANNVNDGVARLFTVTVDGVGGELKFYTNGVEEVSSPAAITTVNQPTNPSAYFKIKQGWLDSLAYYDRVLTQSEITENFNRTGL